MRASGHRWRQRFLTEFWGIGLLDTSPEALIASILGCSGRIPLSAIAPVSWLPAPSGDRYFADPFGWPGRRNILLCENYAYRTGLGTISLLNLETPGDSAIHPVELSFSCHLSYPFLWEDARSNGTARIYCLPESGAARKTSIFELAADDGFERLQARPIAQIADNLPMADPTLFQHQGRYWIAYTDTDIGFHDNLCLRFSETLEGPWRPHPRNPVKVDLSSSRSAGTVFTVGDALYRPAQDCSESYGGALAINRIVRCDLEGYAEETIGFIDPDPDGPYPDGVHTLSWHEGRWLIDGKRHRVCASELIRKFIGRLRSDRGQAA